MALPLLFPVIAIGAAALSGLGGTSRILTSGHRMKQDKQRYDDRRQKYVGAVEYYAIRRQAAQGRLDDLGKVRLKAMRTLGQVAEFLKKAKVKDRDLYEHINVTPQQLAKWEADSFQAVGILAALAGGGASGVATASAVSGLVAALGTASTGTAISTLSGAAATNATLGWLGGGSLAVGGGGMALGGAVLNGLVIGPALLVTGLVVGRRADKLATKVDAEVAKMDIAEAKIERQLAILEVFRKRIDELARSTAKLDKILEVFLRKADPEKLRDAYRAAKLAKALGGLLEVKLLDKDGNIPGVDT